MRLATADEVRNRIRIGAQATDVTTAIESALDAATVAIGSLLGTPLAVSDRIDFFNIKKSFFSTQNEFMFFLEQGFVDGDVTMYLAEYGYRLTYPIPAQNVITVDQSDIMLDADKGTVYYTATYDIPADGIATVAVKYSAGFKDETDARIPDWLKEAAISMCVQYMHTHTQAHKKMDVKDMSSTMFRLARVALNEKVRPRALGLFPSRSLVL